MSSILLSPKNKILCDEVQRQGYSLGGLLGVGKQGAVVQLLNSRHGTCEKVIKFLNTNWSDGLVDEELKKIKHPSICSPEIIFYRTKDGKISINPFANAIKVAAVYPYIEVAQNGFEMVTRDQLSFLEFAKSLAEAVKFLKDRKIAHQDLYKNILITSGGRPVIIDFDQAVLGDDFDEDRDDVQCMIDYLADIGISCVSDDLFDELRKKSDDINAIISILDEAAFELSGEDFVLLEEE